MKFIYSRLRNENGNIIARIQLLHPVQVPRWPSNFAPGIKTKFKDFRGEI